VRRSESNLSRDGRRSRPFDTRIELSTTPHTLALTIPPLRPTSKHLAPFGFAAFWFAIIAFVTVSQRPRGAFESLVLLLFWAVGFAMVWRFALPLVQTTRLTLDREKGTLAVTPFGRRRSLWTSELRSHIGEHVRYRYETMSVAKRPGWALLLEHGVETYPLLDGYSEQEMRWLESELGDWLSRLR
jgi:hypothetical protein